MAEYVTVVSVDNGHNQIEKHQQQHHLMDSSKIKETDQSKDSQFITVLSIGDHNQNGKGKSNDGDKSDVSLLSSVEQQQIEEITVYRLPGERLGFGLKFQGGTKSAENIQRLFIQSCATDSPASRATSSWGHLREGDEILQIDGVDVTEMTRLECVKCLKESYLAIRLLVRNGEGKPYDTSTKDTSDNCGDEKKHMPPPPPPVPPRKINRRKSKEKISPEFQCKISTNEKPFTPPPESEYYINLFAEENEFKLRESESDDTASTISTVIDNFSINSNTDLNMNFKTNSNAKSADLAKVLKSFTLLEKEFNVEATTKLDDCLLRLQPPKSFQDDGDGKVEIIENVDNIKNESKIKGKTKVVSGKTYENVMIKDQKSDIDSEYENVLVSNKIVPINYENVKIISSVPKDDQQKSPSIVDVKVPPTPLPRQAITVEPKVRSMIPPIMPLPRFKQCTKEEYIDEVHECKVIIDENGNKEDSCNLPRLINFLPKVSPELNNSRDSEQNNSSTKNNGNLDEVDAIVVKKCIRVVSSDENEDSYVDSSSDEDVEKVYEPGSMEKRDSSDTFSDEDGEKLGPPELLNTPGPSEAYFNFHWSPQMLPTIGEVEEEFSSLEPNAGPILIIDEAVDDITPDGSSDYEVQSVNKQSTTIPTEQQSTAKKSNISDKADTEQGGSDKRIEEVNQLPTIDKNRSDIDAKKDTVKNTSVNLNSKNLKTNSNRNSDKIEIVEKIVDVTKVKQNLVPPIVSPKSKDLVKESKIELPKKPEITLEQTNKLNKNDNQSEIKENNKLTTKIRSKIAKLTTRKSSPEKTSPKKEEPKKMDSKQRIILKPAKADTTKIPKQKKDKNKPIAEMDHEKYTPLNDDVRSSNLKTDCDRKCVNEDEKASEVKFTSKENLTISNPLVQSHKNIKTDSMDEKIVVNAPKSLKESTIQVLQTISVERLNEPVIVKNSDNSDQKVIDTEVVHNENSETVVAEEKVKFSKTTVERIILGASDQTMKQSQEEKINDGEVFDVKDSPPSMEHNIALISQPILVNDLHIISPPTFSRLPPDGHEFPPNFTEPIIITPILKQSGLINNTTKLAKEDKLSSREDAPPLPKTVPPSSKKIYRQDLIITVDDTRSSPSVDSGTPRLYDNGTNHNNKKNWNPAVLEDKTVRKEIMITAKNGHIINGNHNTTDSHTNGFEYRRRSIENSDAFKKFDSVPRKGGLSGTLPSNWRKDEKSEKSVRDKIAMFSNDDSPPVNKAVLGPRKSLNKSTENLLFENPGGRSRRPSDSGSVSLSKKAQSVENLDEINRSFGSRMVESNENNTVTDSNNQSYSLEYSSQYSLKGLGKAYSVENLNQTMPNLRTESCESKKYSTYSSCTIPSTYASLPRTKPPSVARTTSFSGNNYDDKRKTSLNNLLEQRKRSMSKLRGLIIPEKTALGEEGSNSLVLDLPEIQNKDAQKVLLSNNNGLTTYSKREPVVPNPRHYVPAYQSITPPLDNSYKSIFSTQNRPLSSIVRSTDIKALKKAPQILPPVKPPRTSLILGSRSSIDGQRSPLDDSEDSDSVFSSKISSPPNSPITQVSPEKYPLTRTLSSETNTSIASSTTSTLTSGSGSQASCSSVGSTPTIDMSRKIVKSSSNESYVNRKNILALAKCRSGKDESGRQKTRYDDEDSTDGCDEEETRRVPKTKLRNSGSSSLNIKSLEVVDNSQPINYRLVTNADNLVDMVINVASYVEVTSDTDADSKMSINSDAKIIAKFIDEERRSSTKAPKVERKCTPKEDGKILSRITQDKMSESNELAKWVRNEVAKSLKNGELQSKTQDKPKNSVVAKSQEYISVSESIQKFNSSSIIESPKIPSIVTTPANDQKKSLSRSADIQKTFEMKMNNNNSNYTISPLKSPRGTYHERFSSLDSIASSSSGVSSTQNPSDSFQNLQGTPTDYGSFSSYGSNHSLITPADLQQIVEEADPPLKIPEAFVVVLQRDTPESSVGVTLAGGADYETKEITIHRILNNSPAYKDGRLRKGDRLLSINGLSMRGLTHRESVSVLKTPRIEVVMVVTRSESLVTDDLGKNKRSSLGSMTSLNEKLNGGSIENGIRKSYHKASRSLDLDIDRTSNPGSINDECKSVDAEESTSSSIGDDGVFGMTNDDANQGAKHRIVEILKDSCGLGLAIEGGLDSPSGHKPLTVKKVFMGGAAEKTGKVSVGDIILSINDFNTENMTRVQAWNYMKGLPSGPVKFVLVK